MKGRRIAIVGPVHPFRAGIAYCTTELARELAQENEVSIVSFRRQFPRLFYPGGEDRDPSLAEKTPPDARFELDVLDPVSWIREARRLRKQKPDAVIFVWWIWVWAIPYLLISALLPRSTHRVLQCHNVGEKETSFWKRFLAKRMFGAADHLIVHAESEARELERRMGPSIATRTTKLFLPVHQLGGRAPSREQARRDLGITHEKVALCFGHVRPFKGLDIAIGAWPHLRHDVLLLVAGEVWWNDEERYREQVARSGAGGRVDLRFHFVPDREVALYFSAADVVLCPYRTEAQSGVAMTAFHFSRPVIASTVGGFPEILEEGRNGFLVAPEEPASLAAAIDRFFDAPSRESFEEGASESARKYSWAKYGSAVHRILSDPTGPGDRRLQ